MTENISDLSKKKLTMDVNRVALKMKLYYNGDADRIQHFVRVYTLARSIGELERLNEDEQEQLELAAVVHGVAGDDPASTARDILRSCGIEEDVILRVCSLVENTENYDHISSLDHQILVEAISIVQFKEHDTPPDKIVEIAEKRFITHSGKLFLKRAFDV